MPKNKPRNRLRDRSRIIIPRGSQRGGNNSDGRRGGCTNHYSSPAIQVQEPTLQITCQTPPMTVNISEPSLSRYHDKYTLGDQQLRHLLLINNSDNNPFFSDLFDIPEEQKHFSTKFLPKKVISENYSISRPLVKKIVLEESP